MSIDSNYVFEFAWLPNSRHIIALAQIELDSRGRAIMGLYVVDTLNGTAQRSGADQTFSSGGYSDGGGLGVSPDGKSIVVTRVIDDGPHGQESQLYTISVRTHP